MGSCSRSTRPARALMGPCLLPSGAGRRAAVRVTDVRDGDASAAPRRGARAMAGYSPGGRAARGRLLAGEKGDADWADGGGNVRNESAFTDSPSRVPGRERDGGRVERPRASSSAGVDRGQLLIRLPSVRPHRETDVSSWARKAYVTVYEPDLRFGAGAG